MDKNLTIGATQVGGQISIGLLSTRTGDINIGNNMAGGTLKLANNIGVGSTAVVELGTTNRGTNHLRGATMNICHDGGNVNMGVTSSTIHVLGATTINTEGSATTTIGNSTGTLVVNGAGIKTNKIIPSTGTTLTLGGDTVTDVDIGSSTSITTINGTTILNNYAKLDSTNTFTNTQTISSGGLSVTGTTNVNTTGSGNTNIGTPAGSSVTTVNGTLSTNTITTITGNLSLPTATITAPANGDTSTRVVNASWVSTAITDRKSVV